MVKRFALAVVAALCGGLLQVQAEQLESKSGIFDWGGNVLLYYQGAYLESFDEVDASRSSGTGFIVNLELSSEVWKDSLFYFRVHAGDGTGADSNGVGDVLFANLNTLADDNPEDKPFELLEAYYSQKFLNGNLEVVIGKTEPFILIDTNEFANDEVAQFMGKPFVNNPIIDPQDHFAPMLGFNWSFSDSLSFQGVLQSNTETTVYWNGEEWAVGQKSSWKDLLDRPVLVVQVSYSGSFGGKDGNYRFYIWNDMADIPKVGQDTENAAERPDTEKGLVVGVSFDQWISERFALFGRVAFANSVYPDQQFYSLGFVRKGLLYSDDRDLVAFGVGVLVPNGEAEGNSPEWHFETYYRFKLNGGIYVTPDFQLVLNPGGSSQNGSIYAGALKVEFSF